MKIELAGHYTYRRILRSVMPSVAMVLVTSIYSIIDGFFVSNFAGKSGFSAVNLLFPAMMLLGSLGLMVGSGGASLVAKVKGEGKEDDANRLFTVFVRFIFIIGTIGGIVFAIFTPMISRWLGADEGLMPECITYGRLCMIGMPGFALQMAFQSFYMAAEKPQLGTMLSIVAGVVNIVLDAILVWWFKLGVAGAAIATSLSQLVAGIYPLVYFSKGRGATLHLLRKVKTDWRGIWQACSNGLSEYVSNISVSIVSICYNLQLMRHIGPDGVAAYGVVMYISFVYAAVFIGYNIAITPVIGYNFGAADVPEQRSLLRKSVVIITVTGILMTLAAEILSVPTARLFTGYDANLMAITMRAIRLYMLCFLVCGINMFISALFTGLQNGMVSAVAAFARTMVFELGCVWLLPEIIGIDGIWLAVDVAELLCFFLCFILIKKFAPQLC